MTRPLGSLWREPRPAGAPPPVSRADWLLVGGLVVVALAEGVARPDLAGQPFVTLVAMAVMPLLLWRRSHPLVVCLIGFGVAGVLAVVQLLTGSDDLGLASMMAIMLLVYSLVRWGSGRAIAVGVPYVAGVVALGLWAAPATWAEGVGGTLFVLLFVAIGAVMRSRAELWARQQREIRNEERLALARELHDTVAHHVSAIAVQAQAGGILAQTQPALAAQALATIDSEASRTLAEMRAMVRVLREDGEGGRSPSHGVADLPALARAEPAPAVEVTLDDSLPPLPAAVDAAIHRIAQEALTNAVRHAEGATRVGIDVRQVSEGVRLRVVDDGLVSPGAAAGLGFGLTGMAERAHLLGGSFAAGPADDSGWLVEAVLPLKMSA